MIRAVDTHQYYWTWYYDYERYDAAYDSAQEAQDSAERWWAEKCEQLDDLRPREHMRDAIILCRFYFDDDTGLPVEVELVKSEVVYVN